MRICVVDDDPLVLATLSETVAELGHVPVQASDVATALEALTLGVDAVVVDILMPDRDGLDFIMTAKKARPDLRIIAMSGGGRIGANALLAMAKGLGADTVLLKPFSMSDLDLALRA